MAMRKMMAILLLATTLAAALLTARLLGSRGAVAALAVAVGLALFGALIVTTVLITAWWTRHTLQAGADIALKAQHTNDQWDTRKTAALAQLLREGASVGRQLQAQRETPALPWAPVERDWLPRMIEYAGQPGHMSASVPNAVSGADECALDICES